MKSSNDINILEFIYQLEKELSNATTADLSSLSAKEQYEIVIKRAVHVIKPELLIERLRKSKEDKRPLIVKYGIDPTAKDLHLGHVVPIIFARRLQQMGHKIVLVFGDFTALVGDPTGTVSTRPILSSKEIEDNVSSYKEQVGRFIDLSKVEIVYNSVFYKDLSIKSLMEIYRKNKVAPLLQREDFRNRSEGLTIAETLYPTLMAIDSLFIKPDIELGGNDQYLNFEITNEVLISQNIKPECAVTTDLLLGTLGDGDKMSKSKGNFISLRDSSKNIFGKVMSIPDSLLKHYFFLLTDISDDKWYKLENYISSDQLNPMEVKKLLARLIVTFIYSEHTAITEQENFEKVFSKGSLPKEIPTFEVSGDFGNEPWVELLVKVGLSTSKRQAREDISNGALKLFIKDNWEKITKESCDLLKEQSITIKLGKRKFAKINILR